MSDEAPDNLTAGRKKQGDTVDHITVKCNTFHFAKTSKQGTTPAPAMVKWLRRTLPATKIIPLARLKISHDLPLQPLQSPSVMGAQAWAVAGLCVVHREC